MSSEYYKISKNDERVQNAIKKHDEQQATLKQKIEAIKEKTNCKNVLASNWFGEAKFSYICFEDKLSQEKEIKLGVRFYQKNDNLYLYVPNRKYKKGKELQKILEDSGKIFSFSYFLIKELGIQNTTISGNRIIQNSACISENEDYALIKVVKNTAVPICLEKIKESEALMLQGK